MSRGSGEAIAVLEWSQAGVRVCLPGEKQPAQAASIEEASGVLRGRKFGLAISRRQVFLKTLRLPNASKEEAAGILKLRLDSLFPVPSSELAFDFCFSEDVTSEGRLALVAAMRADQLRLVLAELKACGLKPQWISPTALGSTASASQVRAANAVVLELTEEGLALDVVEAGSLVASRLAGSRSASIDVMSEVNRTLAAYPLATPVLVSTGAQSLASGSTMAPLSPLGGLGQTVPRLNLELPEDSAKRSGAAANQRRSLAVVLGLLALVALAAVWDDRDQEGSKVKAAERQWARQKKNIEDSNKRFSTRLASTDGGAKVLVQAFEPAQNPSEVITVATNLLPPRAWLTGITFERGKRMQVRGTALNGEAVTAYVDSLSAQSRFRDVQLVFANNLKVEDTPVVQFAITMHVVGNLPMSVKALEAARR